MRYKKWFNTDSGKWGILEKKMIYIGKLTWTVHSEYATPEERNTKLKELNDAL